MAFDKKFLMRFSDGQYASLEAIAKELNMSVAGVVRVAVDQMIEDAGMVAA